MSLSVGDLDYGMVNLHCVAKALQSQGARVTVSSLVSELYDADLLVVPGVGAFGAAIRPRSNDARQFTSSGRARSVRSVGSFNGQGSDSVRAVFK